MFLVPNRSAVTSRLDVNLATGDGSGTTIPVVVVEDGRPVGVVTEADCHGVDRFTQNGAVVVVEDGRPVGVVTEADCHGVDRFTQIRQVMSTELLTLPAGTDPEQAFGLLHEGRHRLAPVADGSGRCVGILTRIGALRATLYQPAVDGRGRLRVGAALGINGDVAGKAKLLLDAGADLLVVDTAHGHQDKMLLALRSVRELSPSVPVVAGNVVTAAGVADLAAARSSARSWIAPQRHAGSAPVCGQTAACGIPGTSRWRSRPARPT